MDARGVVGLDLTVRSGEVFGFLGQNGAGKTYHYAASNPLREGLAANHVGVLLGVAVIAGTLAPLAFDRRDLAA